MNRFNLWQIALPPAYASAQCNSFWLYYVFRFAFLQLRLLHVAHWPFCHMADLPLYVFGAMTSRRLAFHFHLIVVEEANGNVTKSQLHCSATAPLPPPPTRPPATMSGKQTALWHCGNWGKWKNVKWEKCLAQQCPYAYVYGHSELSLCACTIPRHTARLCKLSSDII